MFIHHDVSLTLKRQLLNSIYFYYFFSLTPRDFNKHRKDLCLMQEMASFTPFKSQAFLPFFSLESLNKNNILVVILGKLPKLEKI